MIHHKIKIVTLDRWVDEFIRENNMTKKSEVWKADKTLNCESVSTTKYWYTQGEFKEAAKLPTPHITSILEFMYRRADYKRQIAIDIMCA